jgi:hypothetical protein
MRDYFQFGWIGEVFKFVICLLLLLGAISFVSLMIKAVNYGFDHIRLV